MKHEARLLAGLLAASLAGCQHSPTAAPQPLALGALSPPAQVCSSALQAPVLSLPSTDAPKRAPNDAEPDIAQIHTVNRPLQDIGIWSEQPDGWSVLALMLGSSHARSIAVRLHDVRLPPQGALWLCSADGRLRQGPYAEVRDGELWSAAVAAPRARLEVWIPTAERGDFRAVLSDVYGGYQR